MPLMYVILKDADANIEEASRRIEEGKSVDQWFSDHSTAKPINWLWSEIV